MQPARTAFAQSHTYTVEGKVGDYNSPAKIYLLKKLPQLVVQKMDVSLLHVRAS